MIDPFTAWMRMVSASLEMSRTGLRLAETMTASRDVVEARTAMMRSGVAATAAERAERFRADLYRHPIALDDIVVAMTASIGIAQFDKARYRDVDEFYSAADRAVYRAKAGGRNRVCRDEVEPVSAIVES